LYKNAAYFLTPVVSSGNQPGKRSLHQVVAILATGRSRGSTILLGVYLVLRLMVWQSGQCLYGDRFTIDRQIGKGGLGITYLAQNQRGQLWVIKTLKDEVMTNPEYAEYRDKYLRDFKDEALRLAICRHPHIVQIENVFHHEELPCIVMEYIQGMDLGQRIKRYGPLSESEALRYTLYPAGR
jgi:serine/threonine protein kinase